MKEIPALSLADEVLTGDVVVIGSGVAGLTAALELVPRAVTVLTKGRLPSGSSLWAQGGVAAPVGGDDSPALHADDTLRAGAGLCDAGAVAGLTTEAAGAIRRLIARGARFDVDEAGRLRLGREGAHGRRRILHAGGDATGAELVRALLDALGAERGRGRVRVFEDAFVHDLVIDPRADGRVVGVLARHAGGRTVYHRAGAVILASGGCGQLWARTTNPPEATGDGLALAARAGARLADLELIQFHPTALDVGDAGSDAPLPLLTEALRGEGAAIVDQDGARFLAAVDPRAELAPRDVVARAIWRHRRAGRRVFLDATGAVGERFPERFPTVWAHCRRHGLDPRREPLPVTPAAHYAMAGVDVDRRGRASLPGLWACGEVTASGVHGANRLASNSLLEALVWGERVARDVAARDAGPSTRTAAHDAIVRRESRGVGVGVAGDATASETARRRLRERMWHDVGLERDGAGLERALTELAALAARWGGEPTELANLITAGRMVAAAALARPESRGAHQRLDYPRTDPLRASRAFWIYDPAGDVFPLRSEASESERKIA